MIPGKSIEAKFLPHGVRVGESKMEMMLDSSSIVSLVHQEVLSQAQGYTTCFEAPKQL